MKTSMTGSMILGAIFVASAAKSQVRSSGGNEFAAIREALVIIETKNSAGSGFIIQEGTNQYVITNMHVLWGESPWRIRTLDGTTLSATSLEVAKKLDLARIRIRTVTNATLKALPLEQAMPTIGLAVAVYGNSGGEGAVTRITGQILGVGPDVIETDAEFVSGNSGSPILTQNGNVLGVATYATHDKPGEDWVKAGTRFEKVRRFGIRVTSSTQWVSVSAAEFVRQTRLLADLDKYFGDVITIMACWWPSRAQSTARERFAQFLSVRGSSTFAKTRWDGTTATFVSRYESFWKARSRVSVRSGLPQSLMLPLKDAFTNLADGPRKDLVGVEWVSESVAEEAAARIEILDWFREEIMKLLNNGREFWSSPVVRM